MKRVVFSCSLLLLLYSVKGQAVAADSLIEIIQRGNEDSITVDALNTLSRLNWQNKSENLALYYSNKAIALGEKMSIEKKITTARSDLKEVHLMMNNLVTPRSDTLENAYERMESSASDKKQVILLLTRLQQLSEQFTEIENRQKALDASLKDYKLQSNSYADASVAEERSNNRTLAIQQLATAQHLKDVETIRNWIIAGSVTIVALLSIVFVQLYRRRQTKSKLEINQLKNKVLRSQLNPHFIFNALNSIRGYIQRYPELADSYLSKFSMLMRQVLENSVEEKISLSDEIAMIENYMQLEALRVQSGFDYDVFISPSIDAANTMVPPLILQPMIENAIWHGLDPSRQRGKIKLLFTENKGLLEAIIEDNGVGIGSAKVETKTTEKKRSLGMQITKQRIDLLNRKSKAKGSLVQQLFEQGSQVKIAIPV